MANGKNVAPVETTGNFVLNYRRDHPKNRCSYGIAGNPGIVVFDIGLFAGSDQPGFVAPASITLSCEMVPVKADTKTAKAEEQAAKAAEKAAKAEAKAQAAAARIAEKAAKAQERAAAAQAKADAVAAKAAGTEGGDTE